MVSFLWQLCSPWLWTVTHRNPWAPGLAVLHWQHMNVLLRVCDSGVIRNFDTELLVYQTEGSVDVLPELHNYVLAPQMAWGWRRWAWSLVLLTIGSTWREKAWVGWNWAHTMGILSSQGAAMIEPSELWSFDVWSCSRCLILCVFHLEAGLSVTLDTDPGPGLYSSLAHPPCGLCG